MSQKQKIRKWVRRLQDILSDERNTGHEQVEALEKTLRKLRKRETELIESLDDDPDKAQRKVLSDRLKLVRRHLEKGEAHLQELRNQQQE